MEKGGITLGNGWLKSSRSDHTGLCVSRKVILGIDDKPSKVLLAHSSNLDVFIAFPPDPYRQFIATIVKGEINFD